MHQCRHRPCGWSLGCLKVVILNWLQDPSQDEPAAKYRPIKVSRGVRRQQCLKTVVATSEGPSISLQLHLIGLLVPLSISFANMVPCFVTTVCEIMNKWYWSCEGMLFCTQKSSTEIPIKQMHGHLSRRGSKKRKEGNDREMRNRHRHS